MTTKTDQPTRVEAAPGRRLHLAGLADWLLALVVGLSVLAVHDVGYILRAPFWLDEAWVAATVRAPLGMVGSLTSSTPIGFTLLLRLVPFGGPEQDESEHASARLERVERHRRRRRGARSFPGRRSAQCARLLEHPDIV